MRTVIKSLLMALVLTIATFSSTVTIAQEVNGQIQLPEVIDPEKVPQDISLYQAVPVLRVTFKVTPQGYELISSQKIMGVPTAAIIKTRPLRISAINNQNESVSTVTLPDPLRIRTTGTDDPGISRLDESTVTVFFENPDQLVGIEVQLFENRESVYTERFEVQ